MADEAPTAEQPPTEENDDKTENVEVEEEIIDAVEGEAPAEEESVPADIELAETEGGSDMNVAMGAEGGDEGAQAAEGGPKDDSSIDRLIQISSMQINQSLARINDAKIAEDMAERKSREVVGEVIDVHRDSFVDVTGAPKVARFLNTYKMVSDYPYNPEKVVVIMRDVLAEAFEAYIGYRLDEEGEVTDIKYFLPYNGDLCIKQAKWAAEAIREKIKELKFHRYKLIVIVTMGEKRNQDIFCCARFLWDFEKDNYTTYTMENPYVFGYAMVFGLYYE